MFTFFVNVIKKLSHLVFTLAMFGMSLILILLVIITIMPWFFN